jgi:hypothetical protein
MARPKFSPGEIVATPGALDAMNDCEDTPLHYLDRHLRGDWGDVDADDKRANDHALTHGGRLLSSYKLKDETKIWIITEADRSSTCILLPSEY